MAFFSFFILAPAPVAKKPVTIGRKAGRGGRGKGRGGTGRGVGRPPRILSPPGALQNAAPLKRERSPSTDDTKSIRQPAKTLKIVQSSIGRKSQTSGSPIRSLRPRGATQPNTSPNSAEDEDSLASTSNGNLQRLKKRPNSITGSMTSVSDKPAVDDPIKRAQEMENYLRTVGRVEIQSSSTPAVTAEVTKRIPRLMGASPAEKREALQGVSPLEWTTADVSHFLRINDCASYSETFSRAVRIIFYFKLNITV